MLSNSLIVSLANAGMVLGAEAMIYGYNVMNRKTCVVCQQSPPCSIYTKCEPNGVEGNIHRFLFGKFVLKV
jgi:hypothetical protein